MPHHALLFRASSILKETIETLVPLLEASEIEFIEVPNFGINDARSLTLTAFRTPNVGTRLGVVVIIQSITSEAENALLKLLEEPPDSTGFLFCIPEGVFLLPTLLSRFNDISPQAKRTTINTFVEFEALDLVSRLALITKCLTEKNLLWQQEMKQGLVAFLDLRPISLPVAKLSALYYVSEHLLTRGASNKQLFEELAFSLPFTTAPKNGTLAK